MGFDYRLLRAKMVEEDKKVSDLANLLCVSNTSIYDRFNNSIPFKDYEIAQIKNFLNIQPSEIDRYFFKPKVKEN